MSENHLILDKPGDNIMNIAPFILFFISLFILDQTSVEAKFFGKSQKLWRDWRNRNEEGVSYFPTRLSKVHSMMNLVKVYLNKSGRPGGRDL